jgi:NitT/TauT family transport system permease protein
MKPAVALTREPLETLAVLAVLLTVWQGAVAIFHVPIWLLPSPVDIGIALKANLLVLANQFLETATGAIGGLLIGGVVGVALAIIMANFKIVALAIVPLLLIDQSIPKVALAPLFVIWFGAGMMPRVIMALVISFLPVVITSLAGMTSVDPRVQDLMTTLSSGRMTLLRKVQLPNAIPYIFSGLKIAIPLSIIGAVVAEFLQSDSGLGYIILIAVSETDTPLIFVALTLMALLSLSLFAALKGVEAIVLRRRFGYLKSDEQPE